MADVASKLKIVSAHQVDDAVRERHGVKAIASEGFSKEVILRERDDQITIKVGYNCAVLTPWQARYLASKLNRLSRRIRERTGGAS